MSKEIYMIHYLSILGDSGLPGANGLPGISGLKGYVSEGLMEVVVDASLIL